MALEWTLVIQRLPDVHSLDIVSSGRAWGGGDRAILHGWLSLETQDPEDHGIAVATGAG